MFVRIPFWWEDPYGDWQLRERSVPVKPLDPDTVAWRALQLERAGVPFELIAGLAADPGHEVAAVRALVGRGASWAQAVRIVGSRTPEVDAVLATVTEASVPELELPWRVGAGLVERDYRAPRSPQTPSGAEPGRGILSPPATPPPPDFWPGHNDEGKGADNG